MLRIAVQSKGRLYDETMMLLEEAGIRLNKGKRILLLAAKGFPVEVLFLRDDDIPESVANGVADVGIVGENEYVEKGEKARLVKRLGFSRCRLSLAIPKEEEYNGVQWFEGKSEEEQEQCLAFLKEEGIDTRHIAHAFVTYTMNRPAKLAVVPVADVLGLGEEGRINIPGTLGAPDWMWRITDFAKLRRQKDFLKKVIAESGRGE